MLSKALLGFSVSANQPSMTAHYNPNPKTVIWIELTSPWEENLTKKHFEKMDKFNKLAIALREGKHHGVNWTVVPLCVEVGASGTINEQPWTWMCKRLGLSKCSKRWLTQGVPRCCSSL